MSRRSSCPRYGSRLLLAALLALGVGRGAAAQGPPSLFEAAPAAAPAARGVAAARAGRPGVPRVQRSRRALLRVDRLQAAIRAAEQGRARPGAVAFLLNLFDDRAWPAVLERTEADRFGHRTWAGHIDGEALSAVTLTAGNGVVAGTVQLGDALFRIAGPAGDVTVEELDAASFAQELPPQRADRGDTAAGPAAAGAAASLSSTLGS